MKPVLVLQHLSSDGPAYLATWLGERGIAFDVRDQQAGQPAPDDVSPYAALALLGGEMSANDPLPLLRHEEVLIRQAVARGIPVLGHCLGGQLMARALGGRVVPSPQPEIGWQPVQVGDLAQAIDWFGSAGARTVFQWHFDAFEPPPGASLLAHSAACAQAFSIGPHLALQFHVEVDAAKLGVWTTEPGAGHAEALQVFPQTVQSNQAMRDGMAAGLAAQHRLADRIYARWISGAGR